MSQRNMIDVNFTVVRREPSKWKVDADAIERLANVIAGLALLGMALFSMHLLIANNF